MLKAMPEDQLAALREKFLAAQLNSDKRKAAAPPPPPPTAKVTATRDDCVLKVAGKRSYLALLDAPLIASADVVFALRDSVKPVPTVGVVLEANLLPEETAELAKARARLGAAFDLERPLGSNEMAQALREKPPNVAKLEQLPDATLETYVPQLVQALKRPEGAEAVAKFLLARALMNPPYVGASVFWALRSEMSKGGRCAAKHGAVLAAYLGACGPSARSELEKQVVLDKILRNITAAAADMDDKSQRTSFAQRELRRLSRAGELPAGMDLPCMPGKRVGRICPDKCRVLSSKAAPMLLIFDDAEFGVRDGPGQPKQLAIFKTRDDLRQDAAMLQSMRQMDALWLNAGHECWLRTYTVAATDVDVGWIEVVRGAKETAEIQSVWGSGAMGAFQNNTLNSYLVEHNDDPKMYQGAQERFCASCAACCVSTYVLGIADRHNGNIMLSTDGRLFHIDFGHVLGHFKKIKGTGIKREKTKLVLTPEMMFVINEGDSVNMNDSFATQCATLMNVLKDQGNVALLLQTLKELVPAELPELDEESIMWLPEVLLKGENDLRQELSNGLNDWVRRLDNANHNRIHQGGPPSGSKPKPLGQDHRRASTVMEAQIEVEELRKLLSASEAKNAELERELAALKLAKTSNFLARHAKGGA